MIGNRKDNQHFRLERQAQRTSDRTKQKKTVSPDQHISNWSKIHLHLNFIRSASSSSYYYFSVFCCRCCCCCRCCSFARRHRLTHRQCVELSCPHIFSWCVAMCCGGESIKSTCLWNKIGHFRFSFWRRANYVLHVSTQLGWWLPVCVSHEWRRSAALCDDRSKWHRRVRRATTQMARRR